MILIHVKEFKSPTEPPRRRSQFDSYRRHECKLADNVRLGLDLAILERINNGSLDFNLSAASRAKSALEEWK